MKKFLASLCVIVLCLTVFCPVRPLAASDISNIEDFNSLQSGDGKYLSERYRDNYALDIEELGLMQGIEKAIAALASIMFSILKSLGYLTTVIFYYSFSFDITEFIGPQIDTIQGLLKNSFFDALFPIAFFGCGVYLVTQLLRRNAQKILGEIGKVLIILMVSFLVTFQSNAFLSFSNTITKQASVEILSAFSSTNIEEGTGLNGYAATSCGVLWSSLVHKPWIALEFGSSFDDTTPENAALVEEILRLPPGSDARQVRIQEIKDSNGYFTAGVSAPRVGYLVLLLIPVGAKCLIYLGTAFFQIVFQVITLFYLLSAPVILLLAVVPSLGGMGIIGAWLKKILEMQLNILMITLMIGVVLLSDTAIYSANNRWGWLVGLVFQTFIAVGLFLYRGKLLGWLGKMQNAIRHPQATVQRHLERYQESGNVYDNADRATKFYQSQALEARRTLSAMGAGLEHMKDIREAKTNKANRTTPDFKKKDTENVATPPPPRKKYRVSQPSPGSAASPTACSFGMDAQIHNYDPEADILVYEDEEPAPVFRKRKTPPSAAAVDGAPPSARNSIENEANSDSMSAAPAKRFKRVSPPTAREKNATAAAPIFTPHERSSKTTPENPTPVEKSFSISRQQPAPLSSQQPAGQPTISKDDVPPAGTGNHYRVVRAARRTSTNYAPATSKEASPSSEDASPVKHSPTSRVFRKKRKEDSTE